MTQLPANASHAVPHTQDAPEHPERRLASEATVGFWSVPVAVFPKWYVWFAVAGFMDIIFTYAVLIHGGREANPIADAVLAWGGFDAMIAFKVLMMFLLILICQYIYEHRAALAKRLVVLFTVVTFIPPVWASFLLWNHVIAG